MRKRRRTHARKQTYTLNITLRKGYIYLGGQVFDSDVWDIFVDLQWIELRTIEPGQLIRYMKVGFCGL